VALAVDGTVLINQSTITNGLTGCPTGGHFPIIICQSGSYRLSGNLTVPDANTTAISISVDNVTLDLNGFSILGPVVCSISGVSLQTTCNQSGNASGIFSTNANITVSNGTIRGMGSNGVLLGGSGVLIERVKAVSNGFNGFDVAGSALGGDAIVTLCQANFNGVNGFTGKGTISNSSAVGNSKTGMFWSGAITGSVSNFNNDKGFEAEGVLIANYFLGNGNVGIKADDVSVIISNALYFSGVIAAPSGSAVLNNVGH
jgi:hypothetical protein